MTDQTLTVMTIGESSYPATLASISEPLGSSRSNDRVKVTNLRGLADQQIHSGNRSEFRRIAAFVAEYQFTQNERHYRRSRSECLLIAARSIVLQSRLRPVPASAVHTPTPSLHATHLRLVLNARRCHERRSSRTSPARTPVASQASLCSDSPCVDARNSRARTRRRRASEGQGPADREPCRNEAGSGNRAHAMPA